MKKPVITVIGSLNMDLTATSAKRPEAGETVLGESFKTYPGGKGANQAVAAARLGAKVHMIGKVGRDPFGEALLQTLNQEGINTSAVDYADNASGVAIIQLVEGDNSITMIPGANYEVTPDYVERHKDIIAASDMVLLQLEIPIETVEAAAACCDEAGTPFILNPAPAQQLPESLIEKAALLTPNEIEADTIFENKQQAFRNFPNKLVVTKGSSGVVYHNNQDTVSIPAFSVSAVDTTGAGDTFNAALAVRLAEGVKLEEACRFANAASAIQIQTAGAQNGMPHRTAVEAFITDN